MGSFIIDTDATDYDEIVRQIKLCEKEEMEYKLSKEDIMKARKTIRKFRDMIVYDNQSRPV